ncbi:unnamed protein product [Penicillium camemberti]|uniref:Str. FM013 n=1 Tax=Penicillium camemberti (strain FM 013) TaxID=1429867 RepID=A0A0G4PJY3_PENC3|nr:unnamed protein product [Penicillium camemberti]
MPPKTAPPRANSSNLARTTTLSGYRNIDFTPDAMRDVDGNGPRVAGLLNLPNVVELHRLMSSKCLNTRKVLKDFTEDRLEQFGIKDMNKDTFPTSKRVVSSRVVKLLVESCDRFTTILLASSPPDLHSPGITRENYFDLRTAWYIRQS